MPARLYQAYAQRCLAGSTIRQTYDSIPYADECHAISTTDVHKHSMGSSADIRTYTSAGLEILSTELAHMCESPEVHQVHTAVCATMLAIEIVPCLPTYRSLVKLSLAQANLPTPILLGVSRRRRHQNHWGMDDLDFATEPIVRRPATGCRRHATGCQRCRQVHEGLDGGARCLTVMV